jgi:hypothetical protein
MTDQKSFSAACSTAPLEEGLRALAHCIDLAYFCLGQTRNLPGLGGGTNCPGGSDQLNQLVGRNRCVGGWGRLRSPTFQGPIRFGQLLPLVIIVNTARVASLHIPRESEGASPAPSAIVPVVANSAVIAAVFTVGESGEEGVIPDLGQRLLPQVTHLQSGDVNAGRNYSVGLDGAITASRAASANVTGEDHGLLAGSPPGVPCSEKSFLGAIQNASAAKLWRCGNHRNLAFLEMSLELLEQPFPLPRRQVRRHDFPAPPHRNEIEV